MCQLTSALPCNASQEVAKTKMPDTNTNRIESVVRMVEGTARSLGLVITE